VTAPAVQAGKEYAVHVYAVVRVKIVGVRARDQIDAIRAAEAAVDLHELFRGGDRLRVGPGPSVAEVEYADAISVDGAYLVDEADDPDYDRSQLYDVGLRPYAPTPRRDAPAAGPTPREEREWREEIECTDQEPDAWSGAPTVGELRETAEADRCS
jgi:hypothetical protein